MGRAKFLHPHRHLLINSYKSAPMMKLTSLWLSFLGLALLVSFLSLNLVACGKKTSPEEQVRQFIAKAETGAEARDVVAITELVSDAYKDEDGHDRRAVSGLVTGYFLRHKNIHLFTQIKDIQFPTPRQAKVKLYVAMTGTPVTGAQALIDLHADLYQFNLILVKEDHDWLLSTATWEPANIKELLQ